MPEEERWEGNAHHITPSVNSSYNFYSYLQRMVIPAITTLCFVIVSWKSTKIAISSQKGIQTSMTIDGCFPKLSIADSV